jgi:ABC-3C protein/Cap4-like dsDNA endonuclease family protein
MAKGQHSAAASAAGYLYQTNWALLDLLRKAPSRPDQAVSLEMHDDVAWTVDGNPVELLQAKLHAKSTAGLGDKDVDMWKTLGIWMGRADCTDPQGADLALVTTSSASSGSAAYALRTDSSSRNVPKAAQLLLTAAQESTNKDTAAARQKFIELTPADRTTFLERVRVLDTQLPPEDLDAGVRQAITWGLPSGEMAQNRFVAEIWRWWAAVSVDMLAGRRLAVDVSETLTFVQELRNTYTSENLPTTVQIDDVTEQDIEHYTDARFIAQLKLVNHTSLRHAVIDYYRATVQETQWLDDNLLHVHELRKFENNLRFEWEIAFNTMLEDLEDLTAGMDPVNLAKERVKAGRRLLNSLLGSTAVRVRAHYNEAFYARGKRHDLADRVDLDVGVGWHPEFATRLAAVVGA